MANAGDGGMGLRHRKMWVSLFLLGFSCFFLCSLFSLPFYSFVFPHCISTSMYLSLGLSASFLASFSFLYFHSHSSVFIQSAFIQSASFPIFCVSSH